MIIETTRSHSRMVLLALTSAAILTSVLHAGAQTLTPQFDELILGFRAAGAPGQSLNLEVDLGNMSNFYGAAAGTTIPLPSLVVQDLVDVYGASWSTRTDLVWGAVATTGRSIGTSDGHAPVGTLWATRPDGQPAWIRASVFAQKTASATIEVMLVPGSAGTLYGATFTSNSPEAAVINATQSGGWTVQDLKAPGTSFGFFNPTIDNAATVPPGGQVVSALYEVQPTNVSGVAGAFLGNLILTANGLSFQAASASVPPPVPGFSASPTNGVVPLTVNFFDNSTGTITNWLWDFGDGVTTTATNPSHTYTNEGSYSVTLAVFGPGGLNILTQTNYIAVQTSNQALAITTGSPLPDGTVGAAYVSTLAATGGTQPYSWAVVSNSLPSGLGLVASTGEITGTPTVATTANFTVQVQDAGSQFAGKDFTLTINPASTRIIGLSGNLIFGNVTSGTTATATLTITNSGNSGLTVMSISYPSGFSGAFSGVIAPSSSADVTVTFAPAALTGYGGIVTVNSDATSGISTIAASGTGAAAPSRIIGLSGNLTFGNVTNGSTATTVLTIANSGNTTLTVSSITYPNGFSGAFSGAIPAGSSTNVTVTFAPTALISYGGTVIVSSDANSGTGTLVAFGAGVAPPSAPTILTASSLPTGTVGLAYNQPLAATGGSTPYQWSLASGRLPSGLTLSVSGVIGGTPLVATNVSFSVRVVGANALSSTSMFSLVVQSGSATGLATGRYDGLAFLSNNIANEIAGSVRITVTKTRTFHAQILLDGTRYSGRGQFNAAGDWTGPLGGLGATLHLDVFNDTDQITGILTLGGFAGGLLANRAVFGASNTAPWTGTYTTVLTGSADPSLPAGLGWANLQISSSGNVVVRGQLGDCSRFKETVPISKFGTWPLFVMPTGPHSVVAGWVTMTNAPVVFDSESMPSDLNADLVWNRPANTKGRFFPAGFNTPLTLLGSKYAVPPPGTSIVTVMDATCNTRVIFGGGGLPGIVTNTVTLTASDQVINCDSGTLTLAVTSSKGSFSGAFVPQGTTKKLRFGGLFLQNGSVGGGYFIGTASTGYVTIEPIIEPQP